MRFEDLEVWQRVMRLSSDIYIALNSLRDFGFRDQITRSGLSIPSNIAEGFERGSNKEFIRFLYYAKGSCGELRSQTYIGIEIGYVDKNTGALWLEETEQLSSMLGGLIKARAGFD
ncbi:MAG: four helix bundle protein [Desulfuromonas sp.]|nr:MAG: four helix bundle protein [Desulfuromonas sp.]